MIRNSIAPALALAMAAAGASAQVTFELIEQPWNNYVGASVSADGTVIVGNQYGSYETFRWEEGSGAQLLGRGTVAVIGTGAGIPRVSDDGTRISATIMTDDNLRGAPGVWDNGVWTVCTPLPPSAAVLDSYDGSAWAISGDGTTVVGLYWTNMGRAMPFAWSEATGGVDLAPVTPMTESARANGCSYDGSVVAGWRALPEGTWQPAVWENGVETILDPTLGFCEAFNVSHGGGMVVGQTWNNGFMRREAAVWRRTESGWEQQILGSLPGTGAASVSAEACSADETIVVGINPFFPGPFAPGTGFIWTQETGMVDVDDFLADNGIVVDPFFDIGGLTDITPDGRVMIGYGFWTDTFDLQTFRITIAPPECEGNANGDGVVDFDDIVAVLGQWGTMPAPWGEGDANGDGVVDFDDIVAILGAWGVECP